MTMESRSEMFETFDGLGLYEQWWNPEEEPKAGIVLVHGLGEHSGRYHEAALRMVHDGFSVYTSDLRGHGKSDGVLAAVDTFEDYLDDLEIYFGRVQERQEQPLFLFGAGMGGLIAAYYVLTRKPSLRGLILSAPAFRMEPGISPFRQKLAGLAGRIFPGLPILAIDPELLSRDEKVVEYYQNDPLVYHGKIPAVTILEMLRVEKSIREQIDLFEVSFLIMLGDEDRWVSPEGSQEFYEKAGSGDKTLKIYENCKHDLLHEPEKQKIFGDILEWMNNRVRT